MQKKITYILSNIDKAIAFEWIAEHLNHQQFDLSFILLNKQEPFLYRWLKEKNIACFFIPHHGKRSYYATFFKTLKLLRHINSDIVHTHLFDANLIGLSTAKLLGIKKRIYTRHHSSFHHEYYPNAVKWDKLTNWLSTDIVAITENVKAILINNENVLIDKIHLIHHGFDLEKFTKEQTTEDIFLREKYQLTNHAPIVGVVSRFINWKGIQYIIPAFKQLLHEFPNAKLVLTNATGPNKKEIVTLLQKELNPNQYQTINFESNLFALYQLFDVYVHVPITKEIEAFGQTYVEALAAGIPSVFTLSGVAPEFIKHQYNAWVVDYKNSDEIYYGIKSLLTNKILRDHLIKNGQQSIESFNLSLFIQKLEKLYFKEIPK